MARLESLLTAYSLGALLQIADRLDLPRDNAERKAGLVVRLAAIFGQREHLVAAERSLSRRQWRTLAYSRLREGPVVLSAFQVRLLAQGATAAEAAEELQGLLTLGCLVFVDQPLMKDKIDPSRPNLLSGRYSSLRVVGFPNILEVAEHRSRGVDVLGWTVGRPADVRSASIIDVQRDVFFALRAAGAGQLRITTKGTPFRADVAKLAAASAGTPSRTRAGRGKSAAPAPPRLWFVLGALLASDLTAVENSKLLTQPAAASLLAAPPAEQARRLYLFWLDSWFSEFLRIPGLEVATNVDRETAWVDPTFESYGTTDFPFWPSLKQARRSIVAAIRQGVRDGGGEWLATSALLATIRADEPEFLIPSRSQRYGYYRSYYDERRQRGGYEGIWRANQRYPQSQLNREENWAEVEGAYILQVLGEPLFWLGLIDLGLDGEGNLASFRLTPTGRHVLLDEPPPEEAQPSGAPILIVQPNFELVVIDASANFGLVSRLDEFAERATLDRAATFRLTRESVVRGLERGQTGPGILSILETTSRAPVPQNVRYSIEEWSRLYERIHVRRGATLLLADSAEEVERWLREPAIAGLLGRRLSPRAVLVPVERCDALEGLLARRGQLRRTTDYQLPTRNAFRVCEPAGVEVMPKHDEPYVRYRLSRFADPVETDGRRRYEITAESIRRAVASGEDARGIVDFLREGSIGLLPTDTVLRVRGWAGDYPALNYVETIAIELPSMLDWANLRAVPEVRLALLRQLDARVGLLDPTRFPAAQAALAERGIVLQPGFSSTSEPSRAQSAKSSEPAVAPQPPLPSGPGRPRGRHVGSDGTSEMFDPMLPMRRLTLKRLSPEMLYGYLERAIREKRTVCFGAEGDDGKYVGLPMRPVRVWRKGDDGYCEAYCAACDEVHVVPLDEVAGVGEVEGPEGSHP